MVTHSSSLASSGSQWRVVEDDYVTRHVNEEARERVREPPNKEVDRCVPQELSLDCCLENERVLGHTGRLLVDIHLLHGGSGDNLW